MRDEDLKTIVWPSCVDIFGQVVVTMAFFFLLVFIILAYFLTQIELTQRVRSVVRTYQTLYQPVENFIAVEETDRRHPQKRNVDELVVQIEEYLKSVPVERVKDIQSLITRRNDLVAEVHKLGLSSYQPQELTGSLNTMAVVTVELINFEGEWLIGRFESGVRLGFKDNSVKPSISSNQKLRSALSALTSTGKDGFWDITVYPSKSIAAVSLRQKQTVARGFEIRQKLAESGVAKKNIRILQSTQENEEFPYGYVEISKAK